MWVRACDVPGPFVGVVPNVVLSLIKVWSPEMCYWVVCVGGAKSLWRQVTVGVPPLLPTDYSVTKIQYNDTS